MSNTTLKVLAIPAFSDNYLWLIHDGTNAAVVDPGDAAPVLATLARLGLRLVAILLTHHHADHVGGVPALLAHPDTVPDLPVYGPAQEKIAGLRQPLREGERVVLPEFRLTLDVLDVPGHTSGHIAYVAGADSGAPQSWLFCGDTLFAGGCGRLFEGTPAQMDASLHKLAALPGATQVYCAHEYTMSNLRFALAVEPGNVDLQQRVVVEQAKRDRGEATVPTYIALELATNPFLRATEPEIAASLARERQAHTRDPVERFAALRAWKNDFK